MDESRWLAERFGAHREHLRAVAYRMLGSATEADDAVQEAWLRSSRADTHDVENLGGWLTTVVARVCLDMLRSRKSRPEVPMDVVASGPASSGEDSAIDPERELLLADAVGPALMVVLDALAPAERIAFVLHDMFGVSFEEIARIVGRSSTAARQLASRARRRVQGGAGPVSSVDAERQRELVNAFFAASRDGDFEALLRVLDANVVLRADHDAVRMGASSMGLSSEMRGAAVVAGVFKGRAQGAKRALVDGQAAAVWAPGGRPRVVFKFTVAGEKIVQIELVADRSRLEHLEVIVLEGAASD